MINTEIINFLSEVDTNVFLFFNGIHSPFWDYFMSAFTGKIIWVPMYATILYILLINFHWKVVLCYVAAIALTITFADQMCSSIIRPVVARLRPANLENPIVDLVHIVNGYRGGSYGFPSCHAANSFGLAMYVVFLFRKRWLSVFIITWAVLNCYTRIYLGVHYPGDLIVGGIIGGFGGWLFCTIAHKIASYLQEPSRVRRFADQMCSSIIRPVVARLRPANLENPIVDLVHIVNGYRGGSYGFPSCHAANSFGLAMYVVFLFRKRWLSVFIITWAVLNCYTRIYLGVHYPGDLIVGGIIGGFGGWLFCTIAHKIASYLQEPSRVRRNTIRQTSVTMYVGFLTVLGIIIYSTIKSW